MKDEKDVKDLLILVSKALKHSLGDLELDYEFSLVFFPTNGKGHLLATSNATHEEVLATSLREVIGQLDGIYEEIYQNIPNRSH